MKTSVPLLIAGDDADDLDEIARHLNPNFPRKGAATEATKAGRFIMGRDFCVIALSFRTLEGAQDAYTDMLRQAMRDRPGSHRTLLLCASSDARGACSAVTRGRFDDFVVFKPLSDPCLLRFRAYRLARSLETEDRIKRTVGEQSLARSRQATDKTMASIAQDQQTMADQAQEDQIRLRNRVRQHLADFEARLGGPDFAGAVKVLDQDALAAGFRDGIRMDLDKELEDFKNRLGASIDDMVARYKAVKEQAQAALAARAARAATAEKPPLSIMVVDDDTELNDTIREMLEMDDHQVIQAFDGDGGYFTAVSDTPDLLLIDINLPKLNGMDLCRMLKAHPRTRDIPIVIVTGNATRPVVESGRQVGVREFLVKPFSYDALREKVKKVTGTGGAGAAGPSAAAPPGRR
ncbi:MAG: response regulator [Gammaproteobacteria bacterium]|nr:response regulator [Gammaproteobacteria bacterium]